jgi:hypothetical protein
MDVVIIIYEISGSHGGEYEDESFEVWCSVVSLEYTDVSEVRTASIISM